MFVKTGDQVQVISGKDKGKKGKILKTIVDKNRVIVKGVNKIKKHEKASQDNPQGAVNDVEAPIDASNVMLLDPSTKKPTRVGFKVDKDGKKIRFSKKTDKPID